MTVSGLNWEFEDRERECVWTDSCKWELMFLPYEFSRPDFTMDQSDILCLCDIGMRTPSGWMIVFGLWTCKVGLACRLHSTSKASSIPITLRLSVVTTWALRSGRAHTRSVTDVVIMMVKERIRRRSSEDCRICLWSWRGTYCLLSQSYVNDNMFRVNRRFPSVITLIESWK